MTNAARMTIPGNDVRGLRHWITAGISDRLRAVWPNVPPLWPCVQIFNHKGWLRTVKVGSNKRHSEITHIFYSLLDSHYGHILTWCSVKIWPKLVDTLCLVESLALGYNCRNTRRGYWWQIFYFRVVGRQT